MRAAIPYIRQDIPIIVIFRALGFESDKEILDHIVYEFNDNAILDLMKPSLEEAFVIQTKSVCFFLYGSRLVSLHFRR